MLAMGKLAKIIRLLCSIFIALLVISFAVSNRGTVTLTLLPFPWQITLPLYLFGLLTLLLGFLWGASHSLAERFTKHLQLREDKKQIEALRGEVISLRAEKSAQEKATTSTQLPSA